MKAEKIGAAAIESHSDLDLYPPASGTAGRFGDDASVSCASGSIAGSAQVLYDTCGGCESSASRVSGQGFKQKCKMVVTRFGGGHNGYCVAAVKQGYIGMFYGALRSFAHEFAHALDSEMERLSPGVEDRISDGARSRHVEGSVCGDSLVGVPGRGRGGLVLRHREGRGV